MEIRDITGAVSDLSRIGLLIAKKAAAYSLADERDLRANMSGQFVDRLHPRRIPVRVTEVIDETPSTRTLRLSALEGALPPFRAGQFVNLFVTVNGVATARPYSISSPPSRRWYYELTVRSTPDGFVSPFLCDRVGVGDELEISGPWGSFHHEPLTDGRALVFLAGGSGITPFMSIIRNAVDLGTDLNITLVYGSRSPDDVVFGKELAELACCESFLKVNMVMSEFSDGYEGTCGLLDASVILQAVGDVEGRTFFMCGPDEMYGLCGSALNELEIPRRRVKSELSGPPPDITAVEGWPAEVKRGASVSVTIEGTGEHFNARCDEPLLCSLERNGVALENLCRSGECAVCRAKLVEGEVFMPPSVTMRRADAAFGYIHPCMSYPVSDLTIRL